MKRLSYGICLTIIAALATGCSSSQNISQPDRASQALPEHAAPATVTTGTSPGNAETSTTAPYIRHDAVADAIISRLQELVRDTIFSRTQLGLHVHDLTADRPLFAHGQYQQLRPASTVKLVTAITALDLLGTDYSYRTGLYLCGEVRDSVLHGDLCLRGAFDPLLGKADLRAFTDTLVHLGIRRIDGFVLFDRSLKDTVSLGWGWCWDDEATPLTPLLYNGEAGLEQHFLAELRASGIACTPSVVYGILPLEGRLVAERIRTIDQILLPMMKKSNNLYAESLFYHIGAKSQKPYSSRQQATRYIKELLTRLGIDSSTCQIADGSGLSLYNYLTPNLLVCLLRYAYLDKNIYSHLLQSLPIAGEDGTLRRRMTAGPAFANVMAKTGTVTGVSTLAGYCTAANGHVLCFAIMNQGVRPTSIGRRFQDRVCQALTE